MPCLCTTITLRLFVRSLAQLDVLTATSRQTSRRHLRETTIRSFSSTRAFGQQDDLSNRFTPSTSRHIPLEESPSDLRDQTEKRKIWRQRSRLEKAHPLATGSPDDAIAELSLESLDAIAAESRPQTKSQDTVVKEEGLASTSRKESQKSELLSKTTFRRTKVDNTSFALHLSAPRAPPTGKFNTERARAGVSSEFKFSGSKERKESEEDEWTPPPREQWQIDKAALKEKFPDGWNPRKRLSPDALAGIRALHAQMPDVYTTTALAENFQVSPEAIRRILKSRWSPDAEEESDRQRRWFNRGKQIYTIHAEKGGKPPKKWRQLGIGDGKPEWMLRKQRQRATLPALITTAKRREQRLRDLEESDSLADRIL